MSTVVPPPDREAELAAVDKGSDLDFEATVPGAVVFTGLLFPAAAALQDVAVDEAADVPPRSFISIVELYPTD